MAPIELTDDMVAYYVYGWKDYPFQVKPVYQILKEFYQEERERLYDYAGDDYASELLNSSYTWEDIAYGSSDEDDGEYEETEIVAEGMSSEEEPGDEATAKAYDRAIYKNFGSS